MTMVQPLWEKVWQFIIDLNIHLLYDLAIEAFIGAQIVKNACNAGYSDPIPGSRRYPGEGNGYPVQYSCLENSTDSEAWQATVHYSKELKTYAHRKTYTRLVTGQIFPGSHLVPTLYLVVSPESPLV